MVTGGNGRLGRELQQLMEGTYLGSNDLDIRDSDAVKRAFKEQEPETCIHLAADTNLKRCEKERQQAFDINVKGTRNVVDQCIERKVYLIYPSTDYVFDGEKGNYREEDYPNPINYYAFTKLLGEYEVQRVKEHLILRGTMKDRGKWRHPFAPVDMYQSLLHFDEYARIMVALIEKGVTDLYHIGRGRYSVYEWAHGFDPDVKPIKLGDIDFPLPKDVSLDCSKLHREIDFKGIFGGK